MEHGLEWEDSSSVEYNLFLKILIKTQFCDR